MDCDDSSILITQSPARRLEAAFRATSSPAKRSSMQSLAPSPSISVSVIRGESPRRKRSGSISMHSSPTQVRSRPATPNRKRLSNPSIGPSSFQSNRPLEEEKPCKWNPLELMYWLMEIGLVAFMIFRDTDSNSAPSSQEDSIITPPDEIELDFDMVFDQDISQSESTNGNGKYLDKENSLPPASSTPSTSPRRLSPLSLELPMTPPSTLADLTEGDNIKMSAMGSKRTLSSSDDGRVHEAKRSRAA